MLIITQIFLLCLVTFQINGIDVRNARHDQVITLLTSAGPNVELEVLRKLASSEIENAPSHACAATATPGIFQLISLILI